jgi:hypothetical protein
MTRILARGGGLALSVAGTTSAKIRQVKQIVGRRFMIVSAFQHWDARSQASAHLREGTPSRCDRARTTLGYTMAQQNVKNERKTQSLIRS